MIKMTLWIWYINNWFRYCFCFCFWLPFAFVLCLRGRGRWRRCFWWTCWWRWRWRLFGETKVCGGARCVCFRDFLKTVKQYLDSYVVYLRNDRDAHNLLNQRFYAQCRLLLRLCLHGLLLVIDPNNKANLALVGNKYYCRYVCRKCENLCV